MSGSISLRRLFLFTAVSSLLLTASAVPQQPARPQPPKLEAVAETRLLMEGLAHSNYRGLERLLRQKPEDVEDWAFIRGQALLIAETGNLLMIRPPRNPGEVAWMDRAAGLRTAATRLARAAGDSDYPKSRAAFVAVADSCNRCHQTFRVPVELKPFPVPERKVKADD
jgi:hypothetical protein